MNFFPNNFFLSLKNCELTNLRLVQSAQNKLKLLDLRTTGPPLANNKEINCKNNELNISHGTFKKLKKICPLLTKFLFGRTKNLDTHIEKFVNGK